MIRDQHAASFAENTDTQHKSLPLTSRCCHSSLSVSRPSLSLSRYGLPRGPAGVQIADSDLFKKLARKGCQALRILVRACRLVGQGPSQEGPEEAGGKTSRTWMGRTTVTTSPWCSGGSDGSFRWDIHIIAGHIAYELRRSRSRAPQSSRAPC